MMKQQAQLLSPSTRIQGDQEDIRQCLPRHISKQVGYSPVSQHRIRHHKCVPKLCIHNALRQLVVDLQLQQNQMKSLSHSPLKTEKANCTQIILEQQAPGRRKGKENI